MNLTKKQTEILFKLYRNFYIGSRHTSEDNVVKGFPKHVRGDVRKELKKLIKEGYITSKPTAYGIEVSLNPRMISEIRTILEERE